MTTAFTAIPKKITISAMRFLGCDMAGPYRIPRSRFIDPYQVQGISMPLKDDQVMTEDLNQQERYPWAGPALFTMVSVLIVAFFWWFVQA